MFASLAILGVTTAASLARTDGGCLDSYLRLGGVASPPQPSGPASAHVVRRIDTLVATDAPGKPVVGFVYRTADGNPFFGSRTDVTPPARPYVRRLFERDGRVTQAQLAAVLGAQHGDAILWIPNAARLLPRLHLRPVFCVASRRLAYDQSVTP